MPCIQENNSFYCFRTPSQAKIRVKSKVCEGFCDLSKEEFEKLAPKAKVVIYEEGAGIWGDYEGSWRRVFLKSHIVHSETIQEYLKRIVKEAKQLERKEQ